MKTGDIVIYHLGEAEELGGNHSNAYGEGKSKTCPAVVVNEGNLNEGVQTWLNVKLMLDAPGLDIWKTSVGIGTGPGQVSVRS